MAARRRTGVGALLLRGLVAGLLAGLLAGGFAYLVGEPSVQQAIQVEEAQQRAETPQVVPPAHEEQPLVSRKVQRAGLILATSLAGLALGGLFSLAFAAIRGRLGRGLGDWSLSTRMAAILFATVGLVPFLKYPANPPGIGDPDTINSRTVSYLAMVAISLLALVVGWRVARALGERVGAPLRQLAGVGAYVVTVAIGWVLLPDPGRVPDGYPATLLWEFRVASLGTQAVLWGALGAGFGLLVLRSQARAASVSQPA
jgi:putative cobalt transporter subunit CbtA